ncbi:MAG: AAA family ATPase [Planctomycetaceae bacterium]
MYEAFYMLRMRPFGVDAGAGRCWLTPHVAESVQHAVASLQNGAEAVLVSGPSGSGKSTVCLELARRLADRLQPVVLTHCEFGSADELWRTILFELGREFATQASDELRLMVLREARALRPEHSGLLVIADGADALPNPLLDELRRLTIQRHEGRSVVQLVLAGSIALEERLATPELSSLSQRIGQQIVLELLTREESRQYIEHRIGAAGGRLSEVFAPQAVDAIITASDGNLHCLNQLCDHALLLGFAGEQRPVTPETVVAALDDLRGLALPWNLPSSRTDAVAAVGDETVVSWDSETAVEIPNVPAEAVGERHSWWDDAADAVAIEIGAAEGSAEAAIPPPEQNPMNPVHPSSDAPIVHSREWITGITPVIEVAVDDRYAQLDRQAELPQTDGSSSALPRREPPAPTSRGSAPVLSSAGERSRDEPRPSHNRSAGVETKLLLDVTDLRNELRAGDGGEPPAPRSARRSAPELAPVDTNWDIVQPEPQINAVIECATVGGPEPIDDAHARTEPMIDASNLAVERPPTMRRSEVPPERRYSRLFTRLQQRRAATAADSTSWPLRLWR